jgi:hypothetical protein
MKNRFFKFVATLAFGLAALIPQFAPIASITAGVAALAPQATRVAAMSVALGTLAPQVAQATDLTNYTENKLIDWFFRGQAFTPPTTIYIGLLTAACSDSAAGTEVTGGSYARVAVTSTLANWAGTQSAGSTTASSGTGGTTSNNAIIAFPMPSATWGAVSYVGWYDASTSGNLLICKQLTLPKTINNGDPAPQFAIGTMTFRIDN